MVYSHHVIEHVRDLRPFVRGIRRLLKPGGLTVIGTEHRHNAWVTTRRVRSWLHGRLLPEFQTASEHTLYFCHHSLAAVLRLEGFEIVCTLVYTHSLAEKLRHARFRTPLSRVAFYSLHYPDVRTGRGNRLLIWARRAE